ncbi:MAG: DHH family phosphoesterase, partial [Verrucomicrobia bacterium]|nr:DHH family phosphoesterase [Verrucomicrobiota bacterium]
MTSTALLLEVFERLGFSKPEVYLPHRLEEGYGLSQSAVISCVERFDPDLVLAVDCGSTSVETIAWLRARGVDVLVLDHHQISDPPPE